MGEKQDNAMLVSSARDSSVVTDIKERDIDKMPVKNLKS